MTIPPLLLQPRPSLCSSHLHLPGLLPNQLQEEELLFFYIFFFFPGGFSRLNIPI